jgi:hypothetical protein
MLYWQGAEAWIRIQASAIIIINKMNLFVKKLGGKN